jgi:fucose permease
VSQPFRRDSLTWLAYALLAFWSYFLNVLGPITPFLQDELKLSYTVASLHFTAFGIGIVLTGLAGHHVVERLGRWRALWLSAGGLSVGVIVLVLGRLPAVTTGAAFGMGLIGSLILVLIPAILSEHHGEQRAIALSEATMISSVSAALAALLVGWFAQTAAGWRLALVLVALIPIVLRLTLGRTNIVADPVPAPSAGAARAGRGLPARYWVYWTGLMLGIAAEFCIIFWGASYLEKVLGVPTISAAQAVSLFIGGMVLGRLAGSRLVQGLPAPRVTILGVLVAAAGFAAFYFAQGPRVAQAAMLVTGLGMGPLYPMVISLAIGTAPDKSVQGGARATLATGCAILSLPLILGRLADAAGLHAAFTIVFLLLAGVFLIVLLASRRPALRPAAAADQKAQG